MESHEAQPAVPAPYHAPHHQQQHQQLPPQQLQYQQGHAGQQLGPYHDALPQQQQQQQHQHHHHQLLTQQQHHHHHHHQLLQQQHHQQGQARPQPVPHLPYHPQHQQQPPPVQQYYPAPVQPMHPYDRRAQLLNQQQLYSRRHQHEQQQRQQLVQQQPLQYYPVHWVQLPAPGYGYVDPAQQVAVPGPVAFQGPPMMGHPAGGVVPGPAVAYHRQPAAAAAAAAVPAPSPALVPGPAPAPGPPRHPRHHHGGNAMYVSPEAAWPRQEALALHHWQQQPMASQQEMGGQQQMVGAMAVPGAHLALGQAQVQVPQFAHQHQGPMPGPAQQYAFVWPPAPAPPAPNRRAPRVARGVARTGPPPPQQQPPPPPLAGQAATPSAVMSAGGSKRGRDGDDVSPGDESGRRVRPRNDEMSNSSATVSSPAVAAMLAALAPAPAPAPATVAPADLVVSAAAAADLGAAPWPAPAPAANFTAVDLAPGSASVPAPAPAPSPSPSPSTAFDRAAEFQDPLASLDNLEDDELMRSFSTPLGDGDADQWLLPESDKQQLLDLLAGEMGAATPAGEYAAREEMPAAEEAPPLPWLEMDAEVHFGAADDASGVMASGLWDIPPPPSQNLAALEAKALLEQQQRRQQNGDEGSSSGSSGFLCAPGADDALVAGLDQAPAYMSRPPFCPQPDPYADVWEGESGGDEASAAKAPAVPAKRSRGRPLGSKNKPKPQGPDEDGVGGGDSGKKGRK